MDAQNIRSSGETFYLLSNFECADISSNRNSLHIFRVKKIILESSAFLSLQ